MTLMQLTYHFNTIFVEIYPVTASGAGGETEVHTNFQICTPFIPFYCHATNINLPPAIVHAVNALRLGPSPMLFTA